MLDPKTIVVLPNRQRARGLGDLASLRESIANFGIINPIIVRQDVDGNGAPYTVLVAGQRRLQCCIDLGRELEVGEFRFWEDLSTLEAESIELEENVKRADLHWRDMASAYGRLHKLNSDSAKAKGESWNIENSAARLGIGKQWLGEILTVFRNIDSPIIADADSLSQAFSRLQREAERRTVSIVNELASVGAEAFGEKPAEQGLIPLMKLAGEMALETLGHVELEFVPHNVVENRFGPLPSDAIGASIYVGNEPSYVTSTISLPAKPPPAPVLVADFNSWAAQYSGPKFTFIHCDFPYGIDYTNYGNSIQQTGPELYTKDEAGYWKLLNTFCDSLDRFCSYSAHIMFWFSMNHYTETKLRLGAAGLFVNPQPLVWFKTDNTGIIPGRDNQYLRQVYETAFICTRGKRPFVKLISNAYGAPTAPNATHPSVKPAPVLRHFFQATIDSTTDVLDPTSGSGSALIAAEDRGARSILGLELNPTFASTANAEVEIARTKRRLAGG